MIPTTKTNSCAYLQKKKKKTQKGLELTGKLLVQCNLNVFTREHKHSSNDSGEI